MAMGAVIAAGLAFAPAAWTASLSAAASPVNTDFTPTATEGTKLGWTQFDGALFGQHGQLVGEQPGSREAPSQTPFTVDFFTVRFSPKVGESENNGFAAGAACDPATKFSDLATCTRYPAIWRFKDGQWQQVALPGGEGSTDQANPRSEGYVGAIAYMADGNVLAVGGDGVYPRRELECSPTKPAGCVDDVGYSDPAGKARAWLFDGSSWHEISDQFNASSKAASKAVPLDGGETPGGLTALDCSQDASDPVGSEDCVAGGLHQLWMWQRGMFANSYDDKSAAGWTIALDAATGVRTGQGPNSAGDFRFRVRDIRWVSGKSLITKYRFVAVTAGCCSGVTANAQGAGGAVGPRLLTYDGSVWSASALNDIEPLTANGLTSGAIADSYYSVVVSPSTYTNLDNRGIDGPGLSVVASPGGPAAGAAGAMVAGGEPGARVIFDRFSDAGQNDSADTANVFDTHLAGVRLVSADGDYARPNGGYSAISGNALGNPGGDGLLDWAVGALSATCEDKAGLTGCRGAAYTTLRQTQLTPNPVGCTASDLTVPPDSSCVAINKQVTGGGFTSSTTQSSELMSLPSYALNSFTDVPHKGSDEAWAVGDKGAILRLGGNGTVGSSSEPIAPHLGAQQSAALADRGAYDAYRPSGAAGETGVVPALAGQPLGPPGAASLLAAGSPDPGSNFGVGATTSIVMSRDGSQGWAITGSDYGSTTLYHYAGGAWTACDSRGIPGQLASDDACASLAELPKGVTFATLARVPLEQDPSAVDDFEVMAIGSSYTVPGSDVTGNAVAVYHSGHWELMDGQGKRPNWMSELHASSVTPGGLVFSAPGDGWLVGAYGTTGLALYHFDGKDWIKCGDSDLGNTGDTSNSQKCGNSAVLPLFYRGIDTSAGLHLAVTGRRVYLAATRVVNSAHAASTLPTTASENTGTPYPMIYYKDHDGVWTHDYDPGCESSSNPSSSDSSTQGCLGSSDSAKQGTLTAISVAQLAGEHFVGWAAGTFGASSTPTARSLSYQRSTTGGRPGLLRLDSDHEPPHVWRGGDATGDYLVDPSAASGLQLLSVVAAGGQERDFLLPPPSAIPGGAGRFPMLEYDPRRARWQVLPTPFSTSQKTDWLAREAEGRVQAFAPDGAGGLWLAALNSSAYFYHYTDQWPQPVFSDVAHPVREPIAGTAAGGDGSFWVATASDAVYRYDRVTGWDRMTIPGWDPGRVVTNPSPAYAVAVGPDGSGVLVGKAGRVADVGASGGVLDAASGVLCSARLNAPPCGTSYDLRAVAVASDGSAMVAGNSLALLWRPASGQFHAIAKPPEQSQDITITGVSMPSPGRAWLTTDAGQVFAGTLGGDDNWSWKLEADAATLTAGWDGKPLQLHAVAIDSSGRGLAVGGGGLVLQRDGDGSWQRLKTGRLDTFYSVALSPSGYGDGALIGGGVGVVVTRVGGRFEVARPSDFFAGLANGFGNVNAARIVGVAVLPGNEPGQIEAWAASQVQTQSFRPGPWPGAILHYTNAPSGSLLDAGAGRARALPDAPSHQGEVSFAAFGKQECQLSGEPTCPEMQGSNLVNEVIARRVKCQLAGEPTCPGTQGDATGDAGTQSDRPAFAVFTGDVGNSAGRDQGVENPYGGESAALNAPVDTDVIHHRWNELIAQPLQDAGVALFGALGSQDLSQTSACTFQTGCQGTRQVGNPGASLAWREAFAGMPAPWGASVPSSSGVEGPSASVCPSEVDGAGHHVPAQTSDVKAAGATVPSQTVPCSTPSVDSTQYVPVEVSRAVSQASGKDVPSGQVGSQSVPSQSVSAGGAHTHYAFDVERGGKKLVRMVFVDTSLKTLSGAAGTQNPVEEQLQWLSEALSKRPTGERAVVVSETPSYSYGPGGATDTLTDSAAFEALMAQDHVDAVVTGRLGWNGLYYTSTLAPGLHCPQPGGSYPDPGQGCDPTSGASGGVSQGTAVATGALAQALSGAAPGSAPPNATLGAYPTVIAASAGGKFGPAGNSSSGSAGNGYWHGYSVIRLEPDGSVNVIQRPVFDWIAIQAAAHVLRPGQHVTLKGFGREPVGTDTPIQYDDINSPAITHRYDLVQADSQRPWVPKVDEALKTPDNPNGYVQLNADCSVACIDRQTGLISTGKGNHPRVYAVGILSVGDKAASWPIAIEPRRSFRPPATPALRASVIPLPRVLASPATNLPSVPGTPNPTTPNFTFPQPPSVPNLPPLSAGAVRPPTPPVPPPPPANVTASALNISPAAVGLNVAPPATVIPPPAPPIQPAPPGGARREARQRQAAAAKSEEGSGSEGRDPADAQGQIDSVDSPNASMTRLDNAKPPPYEFRALPPRGQPSAWARSALYGGGLGLMALVFAFGWTTLRPTPRRRTPDLPAPAWSHNRHRGS